MTTPTQDDLKALLEGSTSCFTFRPLQPFEGLPGGGLPMFISAQDLAPLPNSLPFISIADIPKLPSLNNNGLSLNILDLPLFASLKENSQAGAGTKAQPGPGPSSSSAQPAGPQHQHHFQQQLQLLQDELRAQPKQQPKASSPPPARKAGTGKLGSGPGTSEDGEERMEEDEEDDGQQTDDGSDDLSNQSKERPAKGKGAGKGSGPGGARRGVKKDRADRKRTLNREAQRRFRDRQKAALGELEERNQKQQQEIDSLKVSNKILQENYLALLENYKTMQAKVLQLQLRTGVVLV